MDVVGELINLCAVRGSLNIRCQASGDYSVEHAESASGEALFHMVLEGSCVVAPYDGNPFVAKAGELVIFPKGAAHRLSHASDHKGQRGWETRSAGLFAADLPNPGAVVELDLLCGRFHYDTTAAAFLFDSLPHAMHVTQKTKSTQLTFLTRMIRTEAEEHKMGALEVVTALTTALFVISLRQYFDTPSVNQSMLALLSDKSTAASLLAMYTRPAENWSVASLAALSNMSRSTLSRRYSTLAGKGPAEVLLAVRCLHALKTLRTTTSSIHTIANQVGYQSEAAFSKAFTRQMGITPSQARREPIHFNTKPFTLPAIKTVRSLRTRGSENLL
ncbi:MAG: cupin domain-containing protein [Burkholderiaceae bacterium]|nr:cupin domain-containing protein [Burkholderiaceae bacterium]